MMDPYDYPPTRDTTPLVSLIHALTAEIVAVANAACVDTPDGAKFPTAVIHYNDCIVRIAAFLLALTRLGGQFDPINFRGNPVPLSARLKSLVALRSKMCATAAERAVLDGRAPAADPAVIDAMACGTTPWAGRHSTDVCGLAKAAHSALRFVPVKSDPGIDAASELEIGELEIDAVHFLCRLIEGETSYDESSPAKADHMRIPGVLADRSIATMAPGVPGDDPSTPPVSGSSRFHGRSVVAACIGRTVYVWISEFLKSYALAYGRLARAPTCRERSIDVVERILRATVRPCLVDDCFAVVNAVYRTTGAIDAISDYEPYSVSRCGAIMSDLMRYSSLAALRSDQKREAELLLSKRPGCGDFTFPDTLSHTPVCPPSTHRSMKMKIFENNARADLSDMPPPRKSALLAKYFADLRTLPLPSPSSPTTAAAKRSKSHKRRRVGIDSRSKSDGCESSESGSTDTGTDDPSCSRLPKMVCNTSDPAALEDDDVVFSQHDEEDEGSETRGARRRESAPEVKRPKTAQASIEAVVRGSAGFGVGSASLAASPAAADAIVARLRSKTGVHRWDGAPSTFASADVTRLKAALAVDSWKLVMGSSGPSVMNSVPGWVYLVANMACALRGAALLLGCKDPLGEVFSRADSIKLSGSGKLNRLSARYSDTGVTIGSARLRLPKSLVVACAWVAGRSDTPDIPVEDIVRGDRERWLRLELLESYRSRWGAMSEPERRAAIRRMLTGAFSGFIDLAGAIPTSIPWPVRDAAAKIADAVSRAIDGTDPRPFDELLTDPDPVGTLVARAMHGDAKTPDAVPEPVSDNQSLSPDRIATSPMIPVKSATPFRVVVKIPSRQQIQERRQPDIAEVPMDIALSPVARVPVASPVRSPELSPISPRRTVADQPPTPASAPAPVESTDDSGFLNLIIDEIPDESEAVPSPPPPPPPPPTPATGVEKRRDAPAECGRKMDAPGAAFVANPVPAPMTIVEFLRFVGERADSDPEVVDRVILERPVSRGVLEALNASRFDSFPMSAISRAIVSAALKNPTAVAQFSGTAPSMSMQSREQFDDVLSGVRSNTFFPLPVLFAALRYELSRAGETLTPRADACRSDDFSSPVEMDESSDREPPVAAAAPAPKVTLAKEEIAVVATSELMECAAREGLMHEVIAKPQQQPSSVPPQASTASDGFYADAARLFGDSETGISTDLCGRDLFQPNYSFSTSDSMLDDFGCYPDALQLACQVGYPM